MNTNLIDNTNKQLKEICFEMNLLLVEDDAILLGQLKNLLGRFFGRVDTALNGREAFITYHERHYDLIITDLTMPVLDGIELTRNVKAVNRQQNILVLSAHSESEKLLELISIGIDGFMVKPVNIQVVLTQLAKTCQAIYDHKILDYYSAMLEETNKSLLACNAELDRSLSELTKLRILQEECQETKPKRALESEEIQEDYEERFIHSHNAFYDTYKYEIKKTNEDLEYIEDNFNLILIKAESSHSIDTTVQLTAVLRQYSEILYGFPPFERLACEMEELSLMFGTFDNYDKIEELLPQLSILFTFLEEWRKEIFIHQSIEDINFMDKGIITIIEELKSHLS